MHIPNMGIVPFMNEMLLTIQVSLKLPATDRQMDRPKKYMTIVMCRKIYNIQRTVTKGINIVGLILYHIVPHAPKQKHRIYVIPVNNLANERHCV